jgi:16S rRNA processing protein RimM
VIVGSCGKAHGLRGEVAVYSEVPEVFVSGAELLTDRGGALTVSTVRAHKGHLVVGFAEVADRTTAEAMRNLQLTLDDTHAPELPDDEYWASSLVGLQVQHPDGSQLGIVAGVVTTGAQDRLIVDTGHSQIEVPFVTELVPEVLETHIVVDPPEGLFD